MSRLLKNIELDILNNSSGVERSCKIIERAIYRARIGFLEESADEVETVRSHYKNSPNISVSAWAHLADGIIAFFGTMTLDARSSMLRSRALSVAGKLTQINCLSSAWIAHIDYLKLDIKSLKESIEDVLRLADSSDHNSLSRGCLVVAQSLHWADAFECALAWYKLAHSHALHEGDEATISAIMHNMAWQKLRLWRAEEFGFSARKKKAFEHSLLGAQSAENFDILIGSTALDSLVPSAIAQTLTLRGEYGRALVIFDQVLQIGLNQGLVRLHAELLADRAWCNLNLGFLDAAVNDSDAAEKLLCLNGPPDDSAFAHGGLARIFKAIGADKREEVHRAAAIECWGRHILLQDDMKVALAGLRLPMHDASSNNI